MRSLDNPNNYFYLVPSSVRRLEAAKGVNMFVHMVMLLLFVGLVTRMYMFYFYKSFKQNLLYSSEQSEYYESRKDEAAGCGCGQSVVLRVLYKRQRCSVQRVRHHPVVVSEQRVNLHELLSRFLSESGNAPQPMRSTVANKQYLFADSISCSVRFRVVCEEWLIQGLSHNFVTFPGDFVTFPGSFVACAPVS